jgi:deazaflavin-dependent oxidoreductase (nitroreductase family)
MSDWKRLSTRAFNPIGRALAGHRWFTLYGLLVHRGRTSGREYRTPLVVRPVDGGFVIPMPFGDSTQWAKNLFAAGHGEIVWNGRTYEVEAPEVIDQATAGPALSGSQRVAVDRLGLASFMRVRIAPSGPATP